MRSADGTVQLTPEQALELLRKFGFGGFAGSGADPTGQGSSGFAQNTRQQTVTAGGAYDRVFHDTFIGQVQDGRFNPAGDGQGPSRFSGFSPFSPDPNYLANIVTDREAFSKENTLNGSSNQTQRFGGTGSDRSSPTHIHPVPSVRTTTPLRVESFGYSMNSLAQFSQSRGTVRSPADNTPSRPSSTQASTIRGDKEHEALQDLNGTLASLHLDGTASAEKSRSPGEMTDSSGSVHFKISMNSPASPAT